MGFGVTLDLPPVYSFIGSLWTFQFKPLGTPCTSGGVGKAVGAYTVLLGQRGPVDPSVISGIALPVP